MTDGERLPERGVDAGRLLDEMRSFRDGDADWRAGRVWSLVYHAGEAHEEVLRRAYSLFLCENALNPMAFKSLKRMEAQVVRMTAGLLNGGPDVVGTMTSGGTESILMAVKAARDRARSRRAWPGRPEIVAPRTIHPAFAKAAHYFGLRLRYAEVDRDFRARVDDMRRLIGRRTVLVAASAPQYPHGMVDPIPEIAALARRRGIPFHVDACFGGFILPWLERLGRAVPAFDFRVPGVTSISADLHKYGYAAKGASVVLYRDMSYLRHQFFVDTEFPGGIYASPTMAGTRPGGAIAAAWASMMALGEEGYLRLARQAIEATDRLRARLAELPDIEILGSRDATIVTFRSRADDVDTYALADELQARGWSVDRQQKPPSLHCTVAAHHAGAVEPFVADVRAAVETCRRNPGLARERDAALYGLMAKIPLRGMVKLSVRKVMEELYGPNAAEPDLSRIGEGGGPFLRLVDRYGPRVLDEMERVRAAARRLRPGAGREP